MLTRQADYAVDLEATELGVTAFLVKHQLDSRSLERAIRYALSHQRAVRDLVRREESYSAAARAAQDGMWDWI